MRVGGRESSLKQHIASNKDLTIISLQAAM